MQTTETAGSDVVVRVGAPSARNVVLMASERLALLAVVAVFWAITAPVDASLVVVAVVAAVLLFWNAVLTCEVVVTPDGISRRSWLAIAGGIPATVFRLGPGGTVTILPDGLWLIDEVAFAPRVAWWESRRVRRAIDSAGLVVDDRRAAWQKVHPRAGWVWALIWAATWIANTLRGPSASGDAVLLLLGLVSLVGILRSSPPQTHAPRKP